MGIDPEGAVECCILHHSAILPAVSLARNQMI
jgi:hypothetical protein